MSIIAIVALCAIIAVVAFSVAISIFNAFLERRDESVENFIGLLQKSIAELKEQSYIQSQSGANLARALLEPRPAAYTLLVKARGDCYGKRQTCEFGRIGTLKPGETRIESFIPDLDLPRGGSFVLIAPDDVYVTRVYTGNETYTMGSSQLRRGRFTKCGIANRVQFHIERRATS